MARRFNWESQVSKHRDRQYRAGRSTHWTKIENRKHHAFDRVQEAHRRRRVLMHNHVRHSVDMPCGVNGFRAWTDDMPQPGFKPCRCGWSGLPHYSRIPDYKCVLKSRLPR
jgi:hypothetical protein